MLKSNFSGTNYAITTKHKFKHDLMSSWTSLAIVIHKEIGTEYVSDIKDLLQISDLQTCHSCPVILTHLNVFRFS